MIDIIAIDLSLDRVFALQAGKNSRATMEFGLVVGTSCWSLKQRSVLAENENPGLINARTASYDCKSVPVRSSLMLLHPASVLTWLGWEWVFGASFISLSLSIHLPRCETLARLGEVELAGQDPKIGF